MSNTDCKMKKVLSAGFTLVELLIVIAILGTLSVVVLVAINPVQQLAKTRDTGRKSTTQQLGHSLEAYGVTNNGNYVAEGAAWITALVTAGELSSVPGSVGYSVTGISACSTNQQSGYCYDATTAAGGAPMIIFARLEATADISRCTAQFAGTNQAYAIYASQLGKGGVVCTAGGQPTLGGNGDGANWLP